VINRPPICLSRARHFAFDGHDEAPRDMPPDIAPDGIAARAPGAINAPAATTAEVPNTVLRDNSGMLAF